MSMEPLLLKWWLSPVNAKVVDAAVREVRAEAPPRSGCRICFEDAPRFELGVFRTANGDVLRAADCGHHFCMPCMAQYVAARVADGRVWNIRCPEAGCTSVLYGPDVRRLVDNETFAKYSSLASKDFHGRCGSLLADTDVETLHVLSKDIRMCPECGVLIQRSQGCNSMYCVCGANFNYAAARPRELRNVARAYRLVKHGGLALTDALDFRGNVRLRLKAQKAARRMGVALQEAEEILTKAEAGDEAAREWVRRSRQQTNDANTG